MLGPFRLCDVQHCIGLLGPINFVSLSFNNQKNCVRGESIGHGLSDHNYACPVRCVQSLVLYLYAHGAPPNRPLCAVHSGRRWRSIRSAELKAVLSAACDNFGDALGLSAADISARSLSTGRAMAFLLGNINAGTICLIGRSPSDMMLCYLHITARPIMQGHTSTMVAERDYTLIPATPTVADAMS